MQAPLMQSMSASDCNLEQSDAISIFQKTQLAEIFAQAAGIPYEQANKYKISRMPPGMKAATSPDDANRWIPKGDEMKNVPAMMMAVEESGCCHRTCMAAMGCLNLRAFTMHFTDASNTEHIRLERPCKLGGCCCAPLETSVKDSTGQLVGKIHENFDPYCSKCCEATWCCTFYTDIHQANGSNTEKIFTITTNTCCCGPHNNCFGATCCKDSAVYDITDPNGKVVGHIQKLYGGTGAGAMCRMCVNVNNFVLDFPTGTNNAQRALLLGGLMHMNYAYLEKTGDDDDN